MEEEPRTFDGLHGLQAGSQFGRYRLRRLLGRGGFGYVWEADDIAMDRVVALKLLRSEYSENEKFRQRLFREARAAGRLNEPHVVPIHQCGEIDGQLYIDMRLIDGMDLDAVLTDGGALTPAQAVGVVHQVAAALDAAHRTGLIHRDVKPANILIAEEEFAYLVDFGLANAASDARLTSTGFTIGTFAYMAPERLSADGIVDHRSDIYALACVLYQCLTGSQPYSGDIPALISAHLNSPIPRPSQYRPEIRGGLDEVILKGMAKTAGDRYASAGELARAAHQALSALAPYGTQTMLANTQVAPERAGSPAPKKSPVVSRVTTQTAAARDPSQAAARSKPPSVRRESGLAPKPPAEPTPSGKIERPSVLKSLAISLAVTFATLIVIVLILIVIHL